MYYVGQEKNLLIIVVYVDDILIASRKPNAINRMKKNLSREFEIKDFGSVGCCLGIQFVRDGDRIFIHQKGYIEDILRRFGMTDSKPIGTPVDLNVKLTMPEEASDSDIHTLPYRELVGALTYLAVSTRPDIAFAVSSLASSLQFLRHPLDCC